MKKVLIIFICLFHFNLQAVENKKAYFAGGCFWCMEESFDQVKGVISTISGYSGGHLKNPKYADVIYTDSGHVEAVEITYDSNIINYKKLLDYFPENTKEGFKTEALPSIWENKEEFNALMQKASDDMIKLAKAIDTADDLGAIQKKLMWSNCSACHNRFRAPH